MTFISKPYPEIALIAAICALLVWVVV